MAEETPETESAGPVGRTPGHGGGPALPRKSKSPVTYAKGPAPDPNGGGGGSPDSAPEKSDSPALPRKKADGDS
ncbi:hypothetical protein ACIP79_41750 [Streptomyces sp. NPDC088747]|uniref:hypothetical protein n=1 Tax=Streptomyces sp. NPDC088747 TaxID=3365886 RepID=UPI00382EAA34